MRLHHSHLHPKIPGHASARGKMQEIFSEHARESAHRIIGRNGSPASQTKHYQVLPENAKCLRDHLRIPVWRSPSVPKVAVVTTVDGKQTTQPEEILQAHCRLHEEAEQNVVGTVTGKGSHHTRTSDTSAIGSSTLHGGEVPRCQDDARSNSETTTSLAAEKLRV